MVCKKVGQYIVPIPGILVICVGCAIVAILHNNALKAASENKDKDKDKDEGKKKEGGEEAPPPPPEEAAEQPPAGEEEPE